MHIPALLTSFENSPFYAKFRSKKPEDLKDYVVRSVFHICGKGVLEDERYTAFMNGFVPSVHVREPIISAQILSELFIISI